MSNEKNILTVKGVQELLEKLQIDELKDVTIEGDLEIEIEPSAAGVTPEMMRSITVANETRQLLQHFKNLLGMEGISVLGAPTVQPVAPIKPAPIIAKFSPLGKLIERKFNVKKDEWKSKIEEVTLGATRADGGTRGHTITIGGEVCMPFYPDAQNPHRPIVVLDTFDEPIPLAKAVKGFYGDVMEDPCDWARKNVKEFGADMITIHLHSTHPLEKNTPTKEAVRTIEDILQAVDVPIVIGGSGDPTKDPEVLEAAAEVADGERCMIASANLDMDWERIANAAKKYGHNILSWTSLDMNNQRELDRKIMKIVGMPRDRIIIDPTTAALGYGLDYAYTNMERIKIAGLKGDDELNFPMSSGTTNAWGAREAWMKESPMSEDSDWGAREYRGPLWEVITGMTLAIAGVNMFMMMGPIAVHVLKNMTQTLMGLVEDKDHEIDISNWIREV